MDHARAVRRLAVPTALGLVGLFAAAGPAAAAQVPGAPVSVKAVAGSARITVSWSPPSSDGGSAITGYAASCTGGGRTTTKTAPATGRSVVVSSLVNGTSYTCTVAASNAVGAGPASAATAAVTPTGPPTAPRAVTATTRAATITVSWAAPSSTGGSALTGYAVSCASADGGAALTGSAAATAKTLTLGGLPADKTYLCTVTANSAKGSSPAGTAADYVQHASLGAAVGTSTISAPVKAGQRASVKVLRTTFTADHCFDAGLSAPAGSSPSTGTFCASSDPQYLSAPDSYPATGTVTASLVPRSNTGTADVALYLFTDLRVATSVSAPATVLTFTAPGQVGRLTFAGRANEQLVVTGSKATTTGTFSVRDPGDAEVGFGRFYVTDTVADGPFTLRSTAAYSVLVSPDSFTTGSVTVLLRDGR